MQKVLTISEINQIIVDYLVSKGEIENKKTDVIWNVNTWTFLNSTMTIEQ